MLTRGERIVSTISIVVLSGIVALNLVLQLHKRFDRFPVGRDVGLLEHHLKKTLLIWG